MATQSRRSAKWWVAGTSRAHDAPVILSDGSHEAPFLAGASGLVAPGWTVSTLQTPGYRNSTYQGAVAKPGVAQIPVLIEGATPAEFRAKRDDLVDALNPERGPGLLELSADLQTEDGAVRWVSAVYTGGLEGEESPGTSGSTWWRPVIKFQTLDLWRDVEPAVGVWKGKPTVPFFGPLFPLKFSPIGVDVVSALDLDGNAPTWPDYVLQGPFLSIQAANSRTGEAWRIARETVDTEALVIIGQPGEQAVTVLNLVDGQWVSTGVSAWEAFVNDSFLFPLTPADQWRGRPADEVAWTVNGTGDATRLTVSAAAAWYGAP